jgi:hypothetical protein
MLTDYERLHLLGVAARLSLPLDELAKHYLEVKRDMLQQTVSVEPFHEIEDACSLAVQRMASANRFPHAKDSA